MLETGLTVDAVYRMVETGLLAEDARVELVDGVLLPMSPQGPAHVSLTAELHARLLHAYGDRFHVRSQAPLPIGDRDLPEPDLAVVRGRARHYMGRHPSCAMVELVIEIAVTSGARDRRKAELYARAGIPIYWLIDAEARALIEHRAPDSATRRYATVAALGEHEIVELPIPGRESPRWIVAGLLP